MDTRKVLAVLGAVALAGIVTASLDKGDVPLEPKASPVKELDGTEKPLDTQKEVALDKETLAVLVDGGKGYVVDVVVDAGCAVGLLPLKDGGFADAGTVCSAKLELRTTTPKCVRRPVGNKSCLVRGLDGGGVDPGELNRFDASRMVGTGCEVVACRVPWRSDIDPDAREDDVIVGGGK